MADQQIALGFRFDTAQVTAASARVQELKTKLVDLDVALNQGVIKGDAYKAAVSRINGELAKTQVTAAAAERIMGDLTLATYLSEKAATAASVAEANRAGAIRASHAVIGDQVIALRAQAGAAASGSSAIVGGMGRSGAAAGQFGYKLMMVGQTLDDFQYVAAMGLRPVINNLMQFSAVLGIAAIAGNVLWTNWDRIAGLWRDKHTETEAERMERLEKATHKTAEETRELNKHKQKQADIEKLIATQSHDQKSSGERASAAIGIVGGEKAVADLTKALVELDKGMNSEKYLKGRAESLLSRAQSGDVAAARMVTDTLSDTRSGRASDTGNAFLQGGAKWAGDPSATSVEAATKAEAEERENLAKPAADALAKRDGGNYGMTLGQGGGVAKVRKDLIDSGRSERVADEIASTVWAKIMDSTERAIDEKALAEGVSREDARKMLLHEHNLAASKAADAKVVADKKRDDERAAPPPPSAFEAHHKALGESARAAAESNMQGALGAAAEGMDGGNLAQHLFAAQQHGLARALNFRGSGRYERVAGSNRTQFVKGPSGARQFQLMTVAERLQAIGKINDRADAQAVQFQTRRILGSGITRNREDAAQMAKAMVAQARKAINGETGDPATEAQEKVARSTDDLRKSIDDMARNGVKVRVGP